MDTLIIMAPIRPNEGISISTKSQWSIHTFHQTERIKQTNDKCYTSFDFNIAKLSFYFMTYQV